MLLFLHCFTHASLSISFLQVTFQSALSKGILFIIYMCVTSIILSVNHIISDYGVGIWEPNKGKRRYYDHTISEWNIEVYSKNQSLVDRSMFVACRNLGIICIFLKSHNTMLFLPTSSSPSIYDLGVEASPMQVKNFKSFPGNYHTD